MNTLPFAFHGADLVALPSGAMHWPEQSLLVVSDLHLGKSARQARDGGAQLPPYEVRETLDRMAGDMAFTGARRVICLGDSFDAPGLDRCLPDQDATTLVRLQAGVDWTWIEGNHDPGPVAIGGTHRASVTLGPLTFRHIATNATAEVSGHYHPKARLNLRGRWISRACFVMDSRRVILPAYGTYTGGLGTDCEPLRSLMAPDAHVILTGARPGCLPMPR